MSIHVYAGIDIHACLVKWLSRQLAVAGCYSYLVSMSAFRRIVDSLVNEPELPEPSRRYIATGVVKEM